MNEYEKTSIKTMEEVLLNQYKAIINEKSVLRQSFLKTEKDAMIATLAIMGYMVTCDVDMDLKIKDVHVSKI